MQTKLPTWLLALRGVIAIAFGILAVVWPALTALALALPFGAYALIDGVGLVVGGFRRTYDTGQRVAHIVAGVLGIGAGLLALLWPGVTAVVLAILVGVWALLTGVADLWVAIRARGQWLIAAIGVVSVIAGVLILVRPDVGAVAIAQVIGIYAMVAGALMLGAAWNLYHEERHHAGPREGHVRHA